MFKALREKLGNVIGKFSKEVEEEQITTEEIVEEQPVEESKEEKPEEVVEEKKGFFKKVQEKVTTAQLSEDKFDELFWDIEITLMENNMAQEVIDKIKQDLKEELTTKRIQRKKPEEIIKQTLRTSLEEILDVEKIDLDAMISKKKPFVIALIGVNGSGKTTTLAKIASKLKQKYSVVIAASDTFRAAAIQQLEEHAKRLDIKLIKHDYKSDPTAVAYDAIKHAESKNIDVVLIDTAGRLHSNDNLMNELKKLERKCKPDLKIFVGESITGNDCVDQARTYNEQIGIDGIVLSKVDVDDKGGAAISVSMVTKKPIIFIGTGQEYKDLEEFNKQKILDALEL